MTGILWSLAAALVMLGIVALVWRKSRAGARLRERLEDLAHEPLPPEEEPGPAIGAFPPRHRVLPWIFAIAAGAGVHFALGWGAPFTLTSALMVGILGSQFESYWAQKRSLQIETQLADAIDLMVGALKAGAGVTEAMDGAARESRRPLRAPLEDMIGRIRLGDDPQTVYRNLAAAIPLETFLLFSSALSVHWETGGSLAPTLASVGRTIRDRIEISRRIRSNVTQSQASTVAVLLLTYFIAVIMWRTNPEQFHRFLVTTTGQWLVAGTVLLQTVGLAWMSFISRIRF